MAHMIRSRIPFSSENPYRKERPTTNKIVFLSCEGSVTEEEYFDLIGKLFDGIKSKLQFVSVSEDAVHTHHKSRTEEQALELSKSKPKQLVERIDKFKVEKEDVFQFSKYPEDEFWIVTDVDNNLEKDFIEDWENALNICDEKGYGYAVSNPFFEMWLLLHHSEVLEEDKAFAVTDKHSYESTSHFRERLRYAGAPLKDKKHINYDHYTVDKVKDAVERAISLHEDKGDLRPKYYATTVYRLLEKLFIMQDNLS